MGDGVGEGVWPGEVVEMVEGGLVARELFARVGWWL